MSLLGTGIVPSGDVGNQLTALTRRSFIPRLIVQFGNVTPTISAALANAQMCSGGVSSVTVPVQGAAITDAQATDYSGNFNQPANTNYIGNAEYNLKCIIVPIPFLGMEGILQLDAAVIPLIEARMNDAGNSLKTYANTYMLTNATDGTINLDGLPLIAAESGTYGNISKTTNAWWQGNVITAGSVDPTRNLMLRYFVSATNHNLGEAPNMAIMSPGTWAKLAEDYQSKETYMITPGNQFASTTQGAGTGFMALMVANCPIYIDPGVADGECYFFNTKYLSFYIHEAAAFAFTGFASTLPNYTLGYIGALVAVMEFICVRPRSVTRVTGLNHATL